MEIRQCGTHGLSVSSLGLGTLTWGRDTDEDQACAMLKSFVDAGGTLVEVSPLHGSGRALSVLAEALRAVGRHRVRIALRGAMRFSQGANELRPLQEFRSRKLYRRSNGPIPADARTTLG